jgi:hypothetical protein
MVFGHNTNVNLAGAVYHVQTEDRGPAHALIDTTVYIQGRVLHRRTNNYFDLLPLTEDSQQALKLRLDEQHKGVLSEIQSGALQLAIPQPTNAMSEVQLYPKAATVEKVVSAAFAPRRLVIELINSHSWLSGKQASLQLSIKEESSDPVAGAKIDVHLDGMAERQIFSAVSGSDGRALVEFAMPRITAAEAAIAIHAEGKEGKGLLRFALRAKPKVPSV